MTLNLGIGVLFNPASSTLMLFGAKESIAIVNGEWWRLFSPIFLHIGIIHYLFNNAALRIIGRIIEHTVGGFWFLVIYILSGVFGNICSTISNTSIGAGASGAIFGLIGTGVLIEYLKEIQKNKDHVIRYHRDDTIEVDPVSKRKFKWIPGPFTFMALLNIALAILLNSIFSISDSISIGIDNAAHIGGLLSGIVLSFIALHQKISLIPRKKIYLFLCYLIVILAFSSTITYIQKTDHVKNKLLNELKTKDPVYQYFQYSNWLKFDFFEPEFRFLRGRLLMRSGANEEGIQDLLFSRGLPDFEKRIELLQEELTEDNNIEGLKLIEEAFRKPSNSL